MDPLFQRYVSYSPYAFGGNNPIFYLDPDGKKLYPGSKAEAKRILSYLGKMFGNDAEFIYDKKSKTIAFNGSISHADKEKEYLLKVVVEEVIRSTDNDIHYKGAGGNPVGDNSVYVTEVKNDALLKKMGLIPIEYDDEATYTVKEQSGKFVSTAFIGWDAVDRNVELTDGTQEHESDEMLFWHTLGHGLGNKDLNVTSSSSINDTRRVASRRAIGFENFVRGLLKMKERSGNDHGVDGGDWGSTDYYKDKAKKYASDNK